MARAIAANTSMTTTEAWLLTQEPKTYAPYYNGKMSFKLHGNSWNEYISQAFPDIHGQDTSENVYKSVIDLYAENLVPQPDKLRGFAACLVPLLSRGECVVLVDSARTPFYPEHYTMISDGKYTVAVSYTRSLAKMEDYATFIYSDGKARLFKKAVPPDMTAASKEGYSFVEETIGWELFRFALDDKGFGPSLAALQDRVNHSIIDLTVVAEMYARPFWYLLNFASVPKNPYLPTVNTEGSDALTEQKGDGAAGRIFTTSAEGPFGQLTPPTISDMIAYHDSIIDKIPQSFGIPGHYFKPGTGTPPTGVALKVLSKRFNNKIARIREDLEEEMTRLAELLEVEKTGTDKDQEGKEIKVYEFWNTGDDLLQESLDAHGLSLSQMGYPLGYIAEVVTPGVDLEDYIEDAEPPNPNLGQPTDMTAPGQTGLPATPGQVAEYAANPGQRARA